MENTEVSIRFFEPTIIDKQRALDKATFNLFLFSKKEIPLGAEWTVEEAKERIHTGASCP